MELAAAETIGWTALRWLVFRRDGGCVAAQGDKVGTAEVAADLCRNAADWPHRYDDLLQLDADHVKEQPAVGAPIKKRLDKHSYKAPDDEAHLVAVCRHHHQTWATSHRPAERAYLARLYPHVWGVRDAST